MNRNGYSWHTFYIANMNRGASPAGKTDELTSVLTGNFTSLSHDHGLTWALLIHHISCTVVFAILFRCRPAYDLLLLSAKQQERPCASPLQHHYSRDLRCSTYTTCSVLCPSSAHLPISPAFGSKRLFPTYKTRTSRHNLHLLRYPATVSM